MAMKKQTRVALSPGEVAEMFGVDAKTVTRWAKIGRLSSFRTLGGHRRFYEDEVVQLLQERMEPHEPSS